MGRLSLLCLMVVVAASLAPTKAVAAPPPWAVGGPSTGEDLRIELITFGPGDEIPSWFGHTAFHVEDTRRRTARIYNYGMFSFGPDLLPKFLMGRLEFWVGEASFPGTMQYYSGANRDIRAQELNLSPAGRLRLASALATNVLPENRDYLYHHYDDNCATRVRDMIDMAVGGQFRTKAEGTPARMTLRAHTRRHAEHNPYINNILIFWMNDEIDRSITMWDEMFLPVEMEMQVDALEYVNEAGERVPLVASRRVIHESKGRRSVPASPSTRWPLTLLLGLLLGAGAVGLVRWRKRSEGKAPRRLFGVYHFFVGFLFGVPGLSLFLMWTITEHTVTWRNEDLFLANPLTALAMLLAIPLWRGAGWAEQAMRWVWYALASTSLLLLPLKLLPAFDQGNGQVIALLVPANLGFALAFWNLSRRKA